MNFHCSPAVVYIRVWDTIKHTFAHVCFLCLWNFSPCVGSQMNAIKSTKPFFFSPFCRYNLRINLGIHGISYVLMWPKDM